MSLTSFFFRMHDGRHLRLDHNNSEAYRFTNSYESPESDFNERLCLLKRIQTKVKLFTNFTFGNVGKNNGAIIAHGDFTSLYDLTLKEWYNHVEWETDILQMFKMKKAKGSNAVSTVLMKNGAFYFGVLSYEDFKGSVAQKYRDVKIDETIVRTCDDVEN